MGKYLISEKFLGPNFINVVLIHAQFLGQQKGVDLMTFQNELNQCKDDVELKKLIDDYFGDEIILA